MYTDVRRGCVIVLYTEVIGGFVFIVLYTDIIGWCVVVALTLM